MPSFDDKPVVLATNGAENMAQKPRIYLEPAGSYEIAENLFDNHTSTFDETQEIVSSSQHISLHMLLATNTFDTVIFHGDFDGATEIKVYADSELLWSGSPTSRRAIFTEQKTASYIYIEVRGDGKFKFYQVWVGSRIELPNKGTRPYNASSTTSSTSDFMSDSGAVSRYTFYSGKLELEFDFLIDTDADAQKYKDLFVQSLHGTRPVYWIEDPDTHPERPVLMFMGTELGLTYTGPNRRETSLTLSEQGPKFISAES